VGSEAELLEVYESALVAGLHTSLIVDAGRTEFNGVPTKTCIAIGPEFPERLVGITDQLKLL
jgi:PTH2 family peptidyl-tRNA hydrolase